MNGKSKQPDRMYNHLFIKMVYNYPLDIAFGCINTNKTYTLNAIMECLVFSTIHCNN